MRLRTSPLLLIGLLWAAPAWATRYWVSTMGNDANACSSMKGDTGPGLYRLTPQNGAACLTAAGDRFTIKADTYNGSLAIIYENTILVANGIIGNPTIIEGEGAQGCALTHTCLTVLKPTGGVGSNLNDATYITIRLLEFDGMNITDPQASAFRVGGNGDHVLFGDVEAHNFLGVGFFTATNPTNQQDNTWFRRINSHHNAQNPTGSGGPFHGMYLGSTNTLVEFSIASLNGKSGTNSNGIQRHPML